MIRAFVLFLALTSTAFAHKTAQQAAEASAKGGLCHRGGNASYEGLGCASTPEGAFRSCCYANHSGLVTYDVGIARAKNGLFCCCRRYCSKSALGRIAGYLRRAGLKKKISNLKEHAEYYKPKEESESESEE